MQVQSNMPYQSPRCSGHLTETTTDPHKTFSMYNLTHFRGNLSYAVSFHLIYVRNLYFMTKSNIVGFDKQGVMDSMIPVWVNLE